ncbi:MAG: hypothetical protein IKU00_10500 [Bacteroidales bacterium]|nr:hypothetical protein [Bacteroidales bacterium]MBR4148292.1 hypothetical protein [Bacteroidales bacterium]
MKTTAIIILSTCLLALIVCYLVFKLKGKAKDALLDQPLFAISKNGFLGFVIGDQFDFVWARITHLGLATQKEMLDYKKDMEAKQMFGIGSNTIKVATNKFEEIDYISLGFDAGNNLNSIMVYVNNKPNTMIKDYLMEIRDKYAKILGEPNMVNSDITCQWMFKGVMIVLFYANNQITLHIHN